MVGDPSLIREMLTNETEMGSWGSREKERRKQRGERRKEGEGRKQTSSLRK